MNNAVILAAEESATPNPLLPATYDIVWSLVVFVIILVAFWKVFLPKLQAMLDERAAAIEGNIAKADEAQAKAEAALQEYTAQLAGAREEAGEIRDAARAGLELVVHGEEREGRRDDHRRARREARARGHGARDEDVGVHGLAGRASARIHAANARDAPGRGVREEALEHAVVARLDVALPA